MNPRTSGNESTYDPRKRNFWTFDPRPGGTLDFTNPGKEVLYSITSPRTLLRLGTSLTRIGCVRVTLPRIDSACRRHLSWEQAILLH